MKSESVIQSEILEYLAWKYPKACIWRSQPRERKYSHPTELGVPDISIIYGGRYIGLEVKTEKGTQSDSQILFQERVERASGKYSIVRSVNDVAIAMQSFIKK